MKTLIMHTAVVTAIALSGTTGAPVGTTLTSGSAGTTTTTTAPAAQPVGAAILSPLCSIGKICGHVHVHGSSQHGVDITLNWPKGPSERPGNQIRADRRVQPGDGLGGVGGPDVDGYRTDANCKTQIWDLWWHDLARYRWYKVQDGSSAIVRVIC